VLTGYEASQSLRVKVRNLDNVSAVVSAATVAGANQAGSVDFTVDNPDAMRADARKLAIDQAKKKAQTLADQLGVKLGAVKSFSEGSTGGAPVPMMMRDQAMSVGAAPASLPLPAGQQDVIVDVTLTYEID
jgi:uncharacterized protein YggE